MSPAYRDDPLPWDPDPRDDTDIQPDYSQVKGAEDATFKKILNDQAGKTLYFFSLDKGRCSMGAQEQVYRAHGPPSMQGILVDPGLLLQDSATIDRADDTKRTTYKVVPLYDFTGNCTAGHQVNNWYITKCDQASTYLRAQGVGDDGMNYLNNNAAVEVHTFNSTDGNGRSLNGFVADTKDMNNYTDLDFSNDSGWPIMEIELEQLSRPRDAADFGTVDMLGRTQFRYREWPLFCFGQDQASGDYKQAGVPTPCRWPIINGCPPELL